MNQEPSHHHSASHPSIHSVHFPGTGPTLLLLHGVTRNWEDWKPMLSELSSNWSVVAIDQMGHGASARSQGTYYVGDYCKATIDFVRASFDQPITVLGHSLGAMVALSLAAECPDLVRGTVLEDPPFHSMGSQIATTRYESIFQGMHHALRDDAGTDQLVKRLAEIRISLGDSTVRLGDIRDHDSLTFSARCMTKLDPDVLAVLADGKWLNGFDYQPLWEKVECPILLLQGDPAVGGTLTDQEVEYAKAKTSKLEVIQFPGVGHQIHASDPQSVVKLVNSLHF